MIPILYDKNEQDFSHNGIGFLSETIKATVTEERNGSYELSMQYPVTGMWYEKITKGAIVKVKANETSDLQLFRIYKVSKPLNGVVTYYAEHISYDLNGIPTLGLEVKSVTPQTAIKRAIDEAALPCSFTVISDISTLNSTTIKTPCSVRAILGGQTGSILDVWGGEYEFDNFVIRLHAHRGADNGVTIEYGKNLTDIKQEENISECYTHLLPYAVYNQEPEEGAEETENEEVYVYLTERILPLTEAEDIGHNKAYIMDFSDRFGDNEEITEEALRKKAISYIENADLGKPKVNITVSFVQLWQTEEYKNIAALERVKMCDTVTVRFSKLGISAQAKVIKTAYDPLKEKYDSVTLGDAKSSFADTVNKASSDIESVRQSVKAGQAKASEELKKAIEKATSLITGHSGGYVVLNPAEMPQEILILDAPTIKAAVNVWRFNSGGLGHSSTGYNGPYSTAITMDGSIVANFITSGVLNGALLQADSVQASAISVEYKNKVLNDIADATKEISQAFKVADEQVLSSIKTTLKDYSTTKQMNSAINQKAEEITSSVSVTLKDYSTTTQMQSYVKQTAEGIVSVSLKDYSTTSQMKSYVASEIEQLPHKISLSVSDGELGSNASIVLDVDGTKTTQSINMKDVRSAFANDKSAVTISSGTVTFNSNTFVVNSTNFSVTATGTVTATAGKIGGWNIGSATINQSHIAADGTEYKVYLANYNNDNANSRIFHCSVNGTDTFYVHRNGKLYASNATINGQVNADSGRIGNFYIDNGELFTRGALYCDYNGTNRHFRTIIKPAHFDEAAGTAAYSWTLSTQTIREEDYELGTKDEYSPTFILYADGIVETYRNIYLAESMGLRSGKRMRYNETVDTSINLIGYNQDNLMVGSGSQKGDTRIFCRESSRIRCCFGEAGSERCFTFARTDTNFGEFIDGSSGTYVTRYVMNTSGGCAISANGGANALILNASNVHINTTLKVWNELYVKYATYLRDSLTVDGCVTIKESLTVNLNASIKGDLSVSGTAKINNVSIALESIDFSDVGISAANRRVIRTNAALVISSNSGKNAMYLQASTTHIINDLIVYSATTLKSNLTVSGTTTLSGNATVNGVSVTYESIDFSDVGISAAYRRMIRTNNALVISANGGANAMYLDASTTYIIKNLTIGGTAKFSSGSAITSDERLKNSIANLADDNRYAVFYNKLNAVTHKYNDGKSGRTHMAFIAQEVKKALEEAGFTTDEIAAYVEFKSDKEGLDGYECALRYNEFIPLNTAMNQKNAADIKANAANIKMNTETLQELLAEFVKLRQEVNLLKGV